MSKSYEVVFAGTREIEGVKCIITNRIEFLPITHTLDGINALIFTSKYAIYSLIESASHNQHLKKWKSIPSFVISPESAKILYQHNSLVEFVGKKGEGEAFAHEISHLLQGRVPLYLRAKKIISNLDSILKNKNILLQEVIAYKNIPQRFQSDMKPKSQSIIIFSAPSVYSSFIENFGWDSEYIAVAIGNSTFAHFDKGIQAYISPKANFSSCIAFAQEIANKLNTSQ